MLVLLTACTTTGPSTATTAAPVSTTSTTTRLSTTTAPPTTAAPSPNDLAGFDRSVVLLGDAEWTVAVADTGTLRGQGLMRVTELVAVDGMLFVFDEEVSARFFMKNVPIPLDIAFFDSAGSAVGVLTMVPCREDPCPTYGPAAPFRYAVETVEGGFDGIERLTLTIPGG